MLGICTACGKLATVKRLDLGIGPTDAWGVVKNHHDYQALTTCCEAPGEDEATGRVITLDDLRQEDEYYKYERGEDRE